MDISLQAAVADTNIFKESDLMETLTEKEIQIHPLIKKRWSPRAFFNRSVEKEKLLQLFEAARWAPSSYNEQPWRFIVATKENPAAFGLLFDCLTEKNQRWAVSAPVLMLSIAKTHFERNGKPNRHAYHDVGLAMGNLLTQATSMGLYVHQIAGFSTERARELLQIPEGYEPVAMIAIGYLGNFRQLPEDLQEREQAPRKRKELNDIVFSEMWGNPF